MMSKEYCRYIRTYSELEGLQHAHAVIYCAASVPQGAVLELRSEQDGRVKCRAALARCSFSRAMLLMRYLCENGVGPEQWLEVLADAGQVLEPLGAQDAAADTEDDCGKNLDFCAICPV